MRTRRVLSEQHGSRNISYGYKTHHVGQLSWRNVSYGYEMSHDGTTGLSKNMAWVKVKLCRNSMVGKIYRMSESESKTTRIVQHRICTSRVSL